MRSGDGLLARACAPLVARAPIAASSGSGAWPARAHSPRAPRAPSPVERPVAVKRHITS